MPSKTYRYYSLDGVGHVRSAEWIDAESDEDVITRVKGQHPDETCEIWLGRRFVAKVSPKDPLQQ